MKTNHFGKPVMSKKIKSWNGKGDRVPLGSKEIRATNSTLSNLGVGNASWDYLDTDSLCFALLTEQTEETAQAHPIYPSWTQRQREENQLGGWALWPLPRQGGCAAALLYPRAKWQGRSYDPFLARSEGLWRRSPLLSSSYSYSRAVFSFPPEHSPALLNITFISTEWNHSWFRSKELTTYLEGRQDTHKKELVGERGIQKQ